MVTHEWMVKPMRQTEWIEGKGLLIWLAEVFSALGTGLYLVSSVCSARCAGVRAGRARLDHRGLEVALPLFYLGKPWRFWRAIPPFTNAWKTSWIARGMFFTIGLHRLRRSSRCAAWYLHWARHGAGDGIGTARLDRRHACWPVFVCVMPASIAGS